MKYFVVTDVHSFFDEMKKALDEKGFDPSNHNHIFVSLGDLLDRGRQPQECLDYVTTLNPNRRILIRGNHEDLMEEALDRGCFKMHDEHNGTIATARILTGCFWEDEAIINMRNNKEYNDYINSTLDYFETQSAIFVHGWIPFEKEYKMIPDWKKGDWYAARWVNGMDAWNHGIVIKNKTIMCGHWHTSWGHHYIDHSSLEFPNKYSTNPEHRVANFSPFVKEGIVALDACTAFSKKVNCYVFEE